MRIKIFVFISILVIIFGYFGYKATSKSNKKSETTSIESVQKSTPEVKSQTSETLIIGDPNSRATIVEYADFKCPNCNKFHQNVGKKLRTDFIDQKLAKIEFRNIPFIANDSRVAAEATYCANDQKKFVDFHDKVFEYMWSNYYGKNDFSKEFSDVLTVDLLTKLAGETGQDATSFKQCLESKKHKSEVDSDLKKSEQDQVTGTPHIIIGGKAIVGPQGYSTYKTLLEIALR